MKLHGEEVRLGDEVWDVLYGWGEVTGLKDSMKNVYPIGVQFEGASRWYTEDGKLHAHKENPTLFWQPIEFEIPKKPNQKQKEKAWQWVCKTGEVYWITHCYHASAEAVSKRYPKTEVVEPYLPSEIEREVKE